VGIAAAVNTPADSRVVAMVTPNVYNERQL
jgi:hypothetical protein